MVFNLKRKWYDLIAAGKKNVEYREIKPYWAKRLKSLKPGQEVIFRLGYKKGNDIRAVLNSADIGPCPYEGWDGDYYRIYFTVRGIEKEAAK